MTAPIVNHLNRTAYPDGEAETEWGDSCGSHDIAIVRRDWDDPPKGQLWERLAEPKRYRVSFEYNHATEGLLLGVVWTCTCGETGTVTAATKTLSKNQRANAAATRHLKSHR